MLMWEKPQMCFPPDFKVIGEDDGDYYPACVTKIVIEIFRLELY